MCNTVWITAHLSCTLFAPDPYSWCHKAKALKIMQEIWTYLMKALCSDKSIPNCISMTNCTPRSVSNRMSIFVCCTVEALIKSEFRQTVATEHSVPHHTWCQIQRAFQCWLWMCDFFRKTFGYINYSKDQLKDEHLPHHRLWKNIRCRVLQTWQDQLESRNWYVAK